MIASVSMNIPSASYNGDSFDGHNASDSHDTGFCFLHLPRELRLLVSELLRSCYATV